MISAAPTGRASKDRACPGKSGTVPETGSRPVSRLKGPIARNSNAAIPNKQSRTPRRADAATAASPNSAAKSNDAMRHGVSRCRAPLSWGFDRAS